MCYNCDIIHTVDTFTNEATIHVGDQCTIVHIPDQAMANDISGALIGMGHANTVTKANLVEGHYITVKRK